MGARARSTNEASGRKPTAGTSILCAALIVAACGTARGAPLADAPPSTTSDARKYCASIANAASEARFAWQTSKLNELEDRLKARIHDLDAKQAELRAWIEKREAMAKKADEKLVGIYAKMRPETAAAQISQLDDDLAAAILGQLNARQASAIFNEIPTERAVKLAGLVAAGPDTDGKKP